uniref:(northern house mosquito) hypothetical protein n=1 Tax=Culex pipiens TaxID=7175 RepID=A0A8D8G871_CULPI
MHRNPMFFETTYSADYTHPVENRAQALLREPNTTTPPSCFSPPPNCQPFGDIPHPEHQLPCPVPDCANNFLPNLCHTHPSVYEDLQQNAAWAAQSSASPLKSTYQVDYDQLQEYKLGPLPEDTKYFIRECNGTACGSCCAGGLCTCQLCPGGVDGCRGQYPDHGVQKPSKIPRGYVSSSHWPERPYQQERLMTEYRDRVSRTGHLVQREQLHNHQCCDQPSNCRHEFYLKK